MPARRFDLRSAAFAPQVVAPVETSPESPEPRAAPFLKWVGGKRASAEAIAAVFPDRIHTYYEPMLGGGAVFFHLQAAGRFDKAILSDVNQELVCTYDAVRSDVETVITLLSSLRYDRAEYESWRKLDWWMLDAPNLAARMIYLNRTCFNGLYRVNQSGKFNVPFGKYVNPTICDAEGLRRASLALQHATIDFVDCFNLLLPTHTPHLPVPEQGDAVYLDPPYVPLSGTSNFTSYAAGGFGPNEQERLFDRFCGLADRGVAVALSNSATAYIEDLYGRYNIRTLRVRRSVNSRGAKRGAVEELLITANCKGD